MTKPAKPAKPASPPAAVPAAPAPTGAAPAVAAPPQNPLYQVNGNLALNQIQLQINNVESGGGAFVTSTQGVVGGSNVNLAEIAVVNLPTPVVLTQLVPSGSPMPPGVTKLIKTCAMWVLSVNTQVDSYR